MTASSADLDAVSFAGRRFLELGDEHYALFATRMVAWMIYELGDLQRAREVHEGNLRRARALGNRGLEATTLGALASYAAEEGRVEDALALASETVRLYRELGSRRGVAQQLCRCAAALAVAGGAGTAAQLLACSEVLHEEMGASMLPHMATEKKDPRGHSRAARRRCLRRSLGTGREADGRRGGRARP